MTYVPDSSTPFPLLALIDAAGDASALTFATDPQAAALERRARELADEFWPEHVWLTSRISPTLLGAVTRRLELERAALHEHIHIVVVTEERSTSHP